MFISLLAPKGHGCQPTWLAQQPKCVAVKPERVDSKAPSSLAFGSPRETQELIPLFAGLRQLATLNPYSHASLGYAAMGFKTLDSKKQNISFRTIWFLFRVSNPSEGSRRPRNARMSFLGGTPSLDKQRKGTKSVSFKKYCRDQSHKIDSMNKKFSFGSKLLKPLTLIGGVTILLLYCYQNSICCGEFL